MKSTERWINYYDLVLRPTPAKAPSIKINRLIPHLVSKYEEGVLVQRIKVDEAAYRVMDLEHDKENKRLVLLLQYVDKQVSDPTFSDLETGANRVEQKQEGEGIAVAAHVLISLEEQEDNNDSYYSYTLLVESVSKFSRTPIERFLTYIFKLASEENLFFTEEDDGEEKACRPIAELRGHPSSTIETALKTNTLTRVDLVSSELIDKHLDEEPYIKEKILTTQMKIAPNLSPNQMINTVKKIFSDAKKENYEKMRVIYRDDHHNKSETVNINLEKSDAEETFFNKAEIVLLDEPMLECETEIRKDLVAEMLNLLFY